MEQEAYPFNDAVIDLLVGRVRTLQKRKECVVVGLAGGSASGKGYITDKVVPRLGKAAVLTLDHYYFSRENLPTPGNFDEPGALELDLFAGHLGELKEGRAIVRPKYDFPTSSRLPGRYQMIYPASVIWVDGLFALHDLVRSHVDLGVFVDASAELRGQRRVARDRAEGRNLLEGDGPSYWDTVVQPMYLQHIEPTRQHAHIVIVNEGI